MTKTIKNKGVSLDKNKEPKNLNTAVGLSPLFTAANTLRLFSKGTLGELDTVDVLKTIIEQVEEVYDDNMRGAESMLMAQASALNGIFAEMARRSAMNMGTHLPACETYMRMALKAQAQCRATLETLSEVKNPRVTNFVRQQNNATQQQVNNNMCDNNKCTRTEKNINQSNELLSEATNEKLDTRRTPTASNPDSHLETMEVINRT